MGCIKLDILENHYKTPELKIVYAKKELTSKKSSSEGRNYYHARYYDPRTSIFISVDPLAEKAPFASPYRYGFNNPLRFIDPNGMFEDEKTASAYQKEHNIQGTIAQGDDGIWSIDDTKNGVSYFKDRSLDKFDNVIGRGEDGVIQSALVTGQSSAQSQGDGWHPPMAMISGQDVLDGAAGALSHPATSIGLQFGDDALRAIGLAKAIPGINIAANAAGAYVYASDMSSSELSTGRKAYRTVSNGVPLVLGTGAMIGAFGSGAGEAAVIIGAVGWVGEQAYDHVILPSILYLEGLSADFDYWFKGGGYKSMYSDQNLKGNIVPIDSSLNKILLISGYSFDWKEGVDSGKGHDIGLLAQEIEKIYPELVVSDSAGFKKVYYYKLIPIMVEAIKEQQRTIDSQNTLLIDYQRNIKENEALLNSVLIRLEELEKGKKTKNK